MHKVITSGIETDFLASQYHEKLWSVVFFQVSFVLRIGFVRFLFVLLYL